MNRNRPRKPLTFPVMKTDSATVVKYKARVNRNALRTYEAYYGSTVITAEVVTSLFPKSKDIDLSKTIEAVAHLSLEETHVINVIMGYRFARKRKKETKRRQRKGKTYE